MKIISILSFVLILIVVYFAFLKDMNSAFNKYNFAIKDISKVDMVILEHTSEKVSLNKISNEWKLNKSYYVNTKVVNSFLRVFSNLEFVSKVDKTLKNSISQKLDEDGIKVTIKSKNTMILELIVGNVNSYGTGTYVKNINSEAVIINAPGLKNDISKVISTNSLFWRNKTIFNFNMNQIIKIDFLNNTDENKSFKIVKNNETYFLIDYKSKSVESDMLKIKRYLSYFRNINFNTIENNNKRIEEDSILTKNLAYQIVIEDDKNIKYELLLYYKLNHENSEYKYDLNNIYGQFNKDTNLLIIPYFTIDPILKEIDYFMEQ